MGRRFVGARGWGARVSEGAGVGVRWEALAGAVGGSAGSLPCPGRLPVLTVAPCLSFLPGAPPREDFRPGRPRRPAEGAPRACVWRPGRVPGALELAWGDGGKRRTWVPLALARRTPACVVSARPLLPTASPADGHFASAAEVARSGKRAGARPVQTDRVAGEQAGPRGRRRRRASWRVASKAAVPERRGLES